MGFAIFGMGVLLGLDTLVSQAYGARDIRECHRWLFDGLTLALLMSVPVTALCVAVVVRASVARLPRGRAAAVRDYFGVVLLSTPLLLLYAACRRYCRGCTSSSR